MANSPNFNWELPDDTDLVKDGASAMRTLGNAIDSSLVDLKGGTTGQVLSKASNTDLDFTWTNGGDITEVSAGTGISGGGTSGAVTITNSMATAIDAKGDLIAGTGADAFSRLAVGTNGQYLVADSTTATGLKWGDISAGGMTLISTTSLSGSTTTLSSIPSTYKNLRIVIRGQTGSSSGELMRMRFNADSTSSRHTARFYSATTNEFIVFDSASVDIAYAINSSGTESLVFIEIMDYANTTTWKNGTINAMMVNNNSATAFDRRDSRIYYNQTSAISSLSFFLTGGTFTGGSILLYGVS